MDQQNTQGVKIHDVVTVTTKQRVGEDGEKKGHSWNEDEKIGVVMSVSANGFKMLQPDMDEYEFTPDTDDSEYILTISRASDIAYEKAIVNAVAQAKRKVDSATETLEELQEWHKTFKHQISLFGQIARFVKGSLKE